ncbi:FadR/GntR family transcriptional regulator [Thermobifida fusca]|jgi:GntR family galactonate operon transcriptional repressor|nr:MULTISPECIES: FCD domain-containing protein [Thermobifida]AAZ55820.1 transcriptional regulator, GntR family [Thermobifida fusca YX]MBO2529059.1 FadR family transcriptional regulator [Thermobifida sp.]MDD6792575.1 FCD domain-containing protein [Thermobifida fusca]PPS92216.1 GntR family transcriptional regulator [Thermobifida fusca]PZN65441.1 MAG: FadR family transcriptional regulator [Thermobifida fusca]
MSSSYPGRGVHGRVVELLGERVASGMIREGDTLDLRSLSAELGVSMSVVRESVRVLAAKGLVDSRQKRGTFVRPRTEWNLLDADVVRWRARGGDTARLMADLAELRALIEPAAARFAAQRRTENQLADLDQALDCMDRTRGDPRAHALADLEFHRCLLAASGNELLSRMDLLVAPGLVERDILVHSADPKADPVPAHRAVVDAVRARNPDAAEQAMRALLAAADADLRRLAGTALDPPNRKDRP